MRGAKENGEREPRSPLLAFFSAVSLFGGFFQRPDNSFPRSKLHRTGLFQNDKRAHSTGFGQQNSFFAFVLGRSKASPNLSQTNLALSAASNFSLSFSASHGPKSPDLLKKRSVYEGAKDNAATENVNRRRLTCPKSPFLASYRLVRWWKWLGSNKRNPAHPA